MMDASNESRLRRLDALFDQALSLPPERRQEFLSSLDEAVRESLERLLSFDGPSVLGEAIAGLAQIPLPETEPWHGQQVGPYRITREIGRGGMGTVFAAVRDGEFSQTVALKVATRAPTLMTSTSGSGKSVRSSPGWNTRTSPGCWTVDRRMKDCPISQWNW